jgi:wobble nucleotide-excising tRNase
VTFNTRRVGEALKEETFWIVRKSGQMSVVERHNTNPIRTAYEMLWEEVRRSDKSNTTIQNTLRRILEHYFKILGGINPDELCKKFEGKERVVCNSLFAWVNDGSHSDFDDMSMAVDDSTVEIYLRVFKSIFEKSNHLAHYEMMMRGSRVASAADAKPASVSRTEALTVATA